MFETKHAKRVWCQNDPHRSCVIINFHSEIRCWNSVAKKLLRSRKSVLRRFKTLFRDRKLRRFLALPLVALVALLALLTLPVVALAVLALAVVGLALLALAKRLTFRSRKSVLKRFKTLFRDRILDHRHYLLRLGLGKSWQRNSHKVKLVCI